MGLNNKSGSSGTFLNNQIFKKLDSWCGGEVYSFLKIRYSTYLDTPGAQRAAQGVGKNVMVAE